MGLDSESRSLPIGKVLLMMHTSFLPRLHLVVLYLSIYYAKDQGYNAFGLCVCVCFLLPFFIYSLGMILLTNFGWLIWFKFLYVLDVCKGLLHEMLRSAKVKDSKSTWKVCWSYCYFCFRYLLTGFVLLSLLLVAWNVLIYLDFQSLLSRC